MRLDKNNIHAEFPGRMKTDNAEILRQPVAEFDRGRNLLQPVANVTEIKEIEFLLQLVADSRGPVRRTPRKKRQVAMCAQAKD